MNIIKIQQDFKFVSIFTDKSTNFNEH